jgi:hypothetical protein
VLFYVMIKGVRAIEPRDLSATALAEAKEWVDASSSRLSEARMDRPDAALIREEYANTVRLLHYGCDRAQALLDGLLNDGRAMARAHAELRLAIADYRRLWVRRNRIGGLAESIGRLEQFLPAAR